MFYLIFFFFFLVALIALYVGTTQKLTPLYVIGMTFITVSGILLVGSGIDFPIDTQITYNASGDVNATNAILRNFNADSSSPNFDLGVQYLHWIFLYGGLIGVVASLFFSLQWTFDQQRKYKQQQLENRLLDRRLEGLERQDKINEMRGIK